MKEDGARRGQVIVEAIVAIAMLTTGFLGMVTLLSQSLALSRTVADNYTATYLAAEGIEVAKNLIDANAIQGRAWNSGFADGDYETEYGSVSLVPDQKRFLRLDGTSGLYSYVGGTGTNFKRLIRVKLLGPSEIQVNSIVSWTGRGGGGFQTNMEDHFLNWRS